MNTRPSATDNPSGLRHSPDTDTDTDTDTGTGPVKTAYGVAHAMADAPADSTGTGTGLCSYEELPGRVALTSDAQLRRRSQISASAANAGSIRRTSAALSGGVRRPPATEYPVKTIVKNR
jgi:hypothetical protein